MICDGLVLVLCVRSWERVWDSGRGLCRDTVVLLVSLQRHVRQGHSTASALLPQQRRYVELSARNRTDSDVCRRCIGLQRRRALRQFTVTYTYL